MMTKSLHGSMPIAFAVPTDCQHILCNTTRDNAKRHTNETYLIKELVDTCQKVFSAVCFVCHAVEHLDPGKQKM